MTLWVSRGLVEIVRFEESLEMVLLVGFGLGVSFKANLPTIWTVLAVLTDLAHFTTLTPLEAFGSRFDPI